MTNRIAFITSLRTTYNPPGKRPIGSGQDVQEAAALSSLAEGESGAFVLGCGARGVKNPTSSLIKDYRDLDNVNGIKPRTCRRKNHSGQQDRQQGRHKRPIRAQARSF
jgi:hypothetical protein